MVGQPEEVEKKDAIFNLVWTYNIKVVDQHKKACYACDGSTRGGQVRVLDHTYANSVDQTSSRIFYAAAAAENLIIYGADVLSAFAEAPPSKQGFWIRPDKAFREWWVNHTQGPPIPHGHVIPIISAFQGHPEALRLWEKHADRIICECVLTTTVHEPCLYSDVVEGERVLLKQQMDDFAVASNKKRT